MKKNIIILAVAAAAVILLIIAAVFVANIPESTDPGSSSATSSVVSAEKISLISLDRDEIASVNIMNAYGQFTLERKTEDKDSLFVLDGFENLELSVSTVNNVRNAIRSVTSTQLISEDESRLGEFGLDEPQITVTATLYDGSSYTLFIGDAELTGKGFYANTSLSKDVYLLTSAAVEPFMQKRTSCYPLMLYSMVDKDNFSGLKLEKESGNVEIKLLTQEEIEASTLPIPPNFQVVQPFSWPGNDIYINDKVVAGLATAYMAYSVYTDEITDDVLESCGLDDPTVMTVKVGTEEHVLYIGGKDSDGDYFVMVKDLPLIYIAYNDDGLGFIEEDASRYMNTMIELQWLKDVESMTFETADKTYVYELENMTDTEKNNRKVTCNGNVEIDPSEFTKLYSKVNGITQTGLAENTENASPVLKVIYKMTDGSETVKEFFKLDHKYHFITVNGVGRFLVEGQDVETIIQDCDKVLNQIAITDSF